MASMSKNNNHQHHQNYPSQSNPNNMTPSGNPNLTGGPKYINDFTKALAGEVRVLLAELGQLRDQRRNLQFEIAELMSLKSKHGAGGEYIPDWRPEPEHHLSLTPPPPPSPPPDLAPVRPGWRVVPSAHAQRRRAKQPQRPPSPASVPPLEPPKPNVPAWAQWRPNPAMSPRPLPGMPALRAPSPPPRTGLFGPSTPPPK
ncbi:unnamed protein product [Mycena citricolor]|uniref:Uncharacterized protein n=1 Tax=Mycena citricolor TaxID=2018698 RepID=A0AAD2HL04_9AGAR|nr:unnamed protein product [Mycena citricolor]